MRGGVFLWFLNCKPYPMMIISQDRKCRMTVHSVLNLFVATFEFVTLWTGAVLAYAWERWTLSHPQLRIIVVGRFAEGLVEIGGLRIDEWFVTGFWGFFQLSGVLTCIKCSDDTKVFRTRVSDLVYPVWRNHSWLSEAFHKAPMHLAVLCAPRKLIVVWEWGAPLPIPRVRQYSMV